MNQIYVRRTKSMSDEPNLCQMNHISTEAPPWHGLNTFFPVREGALDIVNVVFISSFTDASLCMNFYHKSIAVYRGTFILKKHPAPPPPG